MKKTPFGKGAQAVKEAIWGGLEDPQVRNLNRRDGRWPRPPLVSVDSFGSLCHLRWQQPTGLTLPSVPSKVNSYRPAFPGRSIFAEGADRAHRSFRSPPSGRFATFGGKCPQGTRFPSVPQALCRSTSRERFERPKGARNAG